jgi:hypothetical protein
MSTAFWISAGIASAVFFVCIAKFLVHFARALFHLDEEEEDGWDRQGGTAETAGKEEGGGAK